MSFSDHYRAHRKGGAEADEAEVTRFVIETWKQVDEALGIPIPEVRQPETEHS